MSCQFLPPLACPWRCAGSTATGGLLQSDMSGENVKALEGVATIGRGYRLPHKLFTAQSTGPARLLPKSRELSLYQKPDADVVLHCLSYGLKDGEIIPSNSQSGRQLLNWDEIRNETSHSQFSLSVLLWTIDTANDRTSLLFYIPFSNSYLTRAW